MPWVTDGRTIYKPHSNVGPVYGASGSPADTRLPTIPQIFNEIKEPPSGSKRGVVGPSDGSPPDGRTPTEVQTVSQKQLSDLERMCHPRLILEV